MDEFKPEDRLKPDPSVVIAGRSRQSSERDVGRRSTLLTLIWTPTIAVRRVRVVKARSEEPEVERNYGNPMKTIRWTRAC